MAASNVIYAGMPADAAGVPPVRPVATPAKIQVTGKLSRVDGKFLIDTADAKRFELRGKGLSRFVGRNVNTTGLVDTVEQSVIHVTSISTANAVAIGAGLITARSLAFGLAGAAAATASGVALTREADKSTISPTQP